MTFYYLEAPNEMNSIVPEADRNLPTLFVAGGITGCPDWQGDLRVYLSDLDMIFCNPRRASFSIHDPNAAQEQIEWEYRWLKEADAICFWFCRETLNPIVLFELGSHLKDRKPIFVGMDLDYSRRQDVEIQARLIRPDMDFAYRLDHMGNQIRAWTILGNSLRSLTPDHRREYYADMFGELG